MLMVSSSSPLLLLLLLLQLLLLFLMTMFVVVVLQVVLVVLVLVVCSPCWKVAGQSHLASWCLQQSRVVITYQLCTNRVTNQDIACEQ